MSDIIENDIVSIFQSRQSIHLDGTQDVHELEQKLAKFYGKKHCLLFSSATTALFAIAIALEIKESHIIAPPLSWGGTVSPFLLFNNQISFSGVDEDLCLEASTLEKLLVNDTKALISVDFGGTAANSKCIKEFCKENGLYYISDSSQSLGAFRDNCPAGAFSDAIVTSFTHGKTLFGGEGGAVITNDEELYEKLIFISQHPNRQKKVFGLSNYNVFAPVNGRVHPITAFFVNQRFDILLSDLGQRQQAYDRFAKGLVAREVISPFWRSKSFDYSTYFDFYAPIESQFPLLISYSNEFKDVIIDRIDESSCLYERIKESSFSNLIRDQVDLQLSDFVAKYRRFNLSFIQ